MVPILSTLRSFSLLTLPQFIVILTLLPFSFQLKDSQLAIYSNGPCLIIRFFESELTDSNPSFPTLRSLEVPLRIAGKNCSQNDPGWITSIDYFMDPVTFDFHLVWADSDSETLWTGRVNSTNYHISDVKQLRDTNSFVIGSRVRSLIVDQPSGKLFVSLPYIHRIEMYNINGLSAGGLQQKMNSSTSNIINLNRTVLLNEMDKIGKVLYNPNIDKLFWIESHKCLWSGIPTPTGIRDKRLLMCNHPLSDEMVYSAVIDPDSDDVYVFYEKGRIERLSGPNWSKRSTVITNCLAEDKYADAKFYTIKMRKDKQFIRFYASDTQHYAFRQISLIKRFETGSNDDGHADEYILDPLNSGILFTDQPNIYDFIFPGDDGPKNRKIDPAIGNGLTNPMKDGHKTESNDGERTFISVSAISISSSESQSTFSTENVIMKTSSNPDQKSLYLQSSPLAMTKPTLELINKLDLPNVKPIKELESIPVDNLDTLNPLSKIIVSSATSPSPIESLPPQITLLTVTSSSTIIYWLYAFLAIGLIIASLWTMSTLIGLRRNYQKVFSDDNSLKENLTAVKY